MNNDRIALLASLFKAVEGLPVEPFQVLAYMAGVHGRLISTVLVADHVPAYVAGWKDTDEALKKKSLPQQPRPEDRRVVWVWYKNYRGETARRRIRPIEMVWTKTEFHPEEQWILLCWDLDKNEARAFAMSGITMWSASG